ncbi:30S ribosome-binding factor RbfA [Aminipila butyrica]|uniref:Ribosome-binding factor A n=1 Tax=Aminipila butyrica TaxID=433296 RepID=A0A858BVG0_9FIRM|nr:30S ribosome-binding factor RbfA [Aminipila butyrica]QIB69045.1 30S ribosome-binding factor RbfA [Aminipila butyrica]
MGKGYRQGRLGEEIRRLIGELLLREIKDPRLSGLVSVSAVEVTSDGSYATVYVTALNTSKDQEVAQKEKEDVLAAFKSAKGLIKREIGRSIKLRHVPELIFKLDTSLEYGRHISQVISSLGIEDYKSEEEPDEEDE